VNGQPHIGSGEIARVACTRVAKGWIEDVLYSRVALDVAEPPKLYDPHVLIIVLTTSNNHTWVPQNLRKSVGCP
jgi:hypothetical protein